MARSFNGTSDVLDINSGLASGSTFSSSLWVWIDASNSTEVIPAGFNQSKTTGIFVLFDYRGDSAGAGGTKSIQFKFQTPNTGFGQVDSGTNTATGTWVHLALTLGASTFTGYVNGASVGSTAVGGSMNAAGFSAVGAGYFGVSTARFFFKGRVADFAVWSSAALTPLEIAALAKGIRPIRIRPAALAAGLPIDGLQSPEPDLSGNKNNGTLTGTSLAFGPPVMPFTPRYVSNLEAAAVAPPATPFIFTPAIIP